MRPTIHRSAPRRLPRLAVLLIAAITGLAGLVVAAPASAAVDVYTTPGEHLVGGRRWRTTCEQYSATVDRCRTEIWSTQALWTGSRYVLANVWAFNNLTYLPSPREIWKGNHLGTPGEYVIGGRRWKTECDTAWTGQDNCRSMIWGTAVTWDGTAYRVSQKWLFNNVVRFLPEGATGPAPAVPAAARVALTSAVHAEFPTDGLYRYLAPIQATGTVTGAPAGTTVTVALKSSSGRAWSTATVKTDAAGKFVANINSAFAGWAQIVATIGPDHAPATLVTTIKPMGLTIAAASQVDPVAAVTVSGRMTPAVANSVVTIEAQVGPTWIPVGSATVNAAGTWSKAITYNGGKLGATAIRAYAATPWGSVVSSGTTAYTRMRWANPVITQTTAAELGVTYRTGCPIGPSNLRTIRINQQSFAGTVYRGEIIVRDYLADRVANALTRTFAGGFPVFQMRNPTVWSGDDKAMMAANNTSAFNCRTVVGNPYAQSPHSYGIAVDLNPVQNPYRDPSGRWWPSTQYVSRTPVVPGMLTSSSAPVVAFRDNSFEWFSGWDWHHFEYEAGLNARLQPTSTPATSSGDLTTESLVVPDGWSPEVADEVAETGSDSWVVTSDPAAKAAMLMPMGCTTAATPLPAPTSTLEGTLDRSGSPGVTVALDFATDADAAAWFAGWQDRARGCADGTMTELSSDPTKWLGQREAEQDYSEVAVQDGSQVRFVALGADVPLADLEEIAATS